jgi:LemA protein
MFLYFVFMLIFIIILVCFVTIYNSLVRLKNNIEKAWCNIDVLLKQRFEELPNLVNTVKGYSKYEQKLLSDITKIRTDYRKAKNIHDVAEVNENANCLISSFFMTIERYPEIKANENYLNLQKRISVIENMITDRREYFNDSVTLYNTRIEQIPYNIIAKMLRYKAKDLFVVEEHNKKKIAIKI